MLIMTFKIYDHLITHKETDAMIDVPEWVDKKDMSSFVADGGVHYTGEFSVEKITQLATKYAQLHWDNMSDEQKQSHERGLEFIKNAKVNTIKFCSFRRNPEVVDSFIL